MLRPVDDSEEPIRPQEETPSRGAPALDEHREESDAGPAVAGGPAADSSPFMGLSVTPHEPITNLEGSKFLACGIDSLDVSIYVRWGDQWEQQTAELEDGKTKAAGTAGITMNSGQFLILPSGRAPTYRWHLQWAEFHLFLGRGRDPQGDTPNVYASINSETLWRHGMEGAIALVISEIDLLGGEVVLIKPSRVDLAADFFIPGGIPHDLLLSHRVPSGGAHIHHMKDGKQETFYQGARKSAVQLRIYDKALEVMKGGLKLWFLDVWKLSTCESVWRVEFQIRRPYLKAYGIDTIAQLRRMIPGLWKRLTEDWFSLRLHDNENVTRRTVHPWWIAVQCCDRQFGEPQPLVRTESQSPADASWFVSHGAGCLLSYAAKRRLDTFKAAAREYVERMEIYWDRKGFAEAYQAKSIQLGFVTMEGSSADSDGPRMEAA